MSPLMAARGWSLVLTLPAPAALQDADALGKPPEAERPAWRQFWADVTGLLR